MMQGQANSDSTTYNNSRITGGNQVSITSRADTNVVGGTIKATQVTANVDGTSGQGTTKQATHVNDFVGTLFGGNTSTGGNPNTGALDAHSSYTGELTTSTGALPQVPGVNGMLSPEKIKDLTDKSWESNGFSRPVVVPPQPKPAQQGETK